MGRARRPVHQHRAGHGGDACAASSARRRRAAARSTRSSGAATGCSTNRRGRRRAASRVHEPAHGAVRPNRGRPRRHRPARRAGRRPCCRLDGLDPVPTHASSTRACCSASPRSSSACIYFGSSGLAAQRRRSTERARSSSTTRRGDVVIRRTSRRIDAQQLAAAGQRAGARRAARTTRSSPSLVLFLVSLGRRAGSCRGRVLQPIERITDGGHATSRPPTSRDASTSAVPPTSCASWPTRSTTCSGASTTRSRASASSSTRRSHELRNPLAVIRTNLDVTLADPDALRRGPAPHPRGRAALDRAHDDARRRPAGVRPQRGSLSVDPRAGRRGRARASRWPTSSARRPRPRASRSSGRPRPDLWVDGDRHALRQALANLLANAVRLAPAGSTIRVRAGARRRPGSG